MVAIGVHLETQSNVSFCRYGDGDARRFGGLEGSKTSGNMRRRVSKLAGEYWWEKERDILGQRG
jgi:hypothetical protein